MTTPEHAASAPVDLATRLTPPPDITTLGALRQAGWAPLTVADEIRRNASARIAAGEPLVTGVLGFEDTVLPQMENAVLAGHDIILLGERGQAKTRIIRSMVGLLDEWLPIVAHSEINDDPFHPISRFAKDLLAEAGEDLPIAWVHRSDRYGEKLATPETSSARSTRSGWPKGATCPTS
jgi:magnesium chelatase subunit I